MAARYNGKREHVFHRTKKDFKKYKILLLQFLSGRSISFHLPELINKRRTKQKQILYIE
jgi:hypothetical protein